ncbi:MAG TPA: hypothetical protein VNV36_17825 [Pseudomonas sp.]|uniref:hypothetical protein n=1 Tax=Pseudomonas sp. TaxID=306 RepID=UPI002C0FD1B8|nr:hypothetical protein [Pseudomonas sp.]HWH88608.1 hypothetical protein [Pseudomonas sp.]
MPIKPPITGITTVSVHVPRPRDPITRPGQLPLGDGGLVNRFPNRPGTDTPRTATDPDLNTITPLPPRVSVSATSDSAPAPAVGERTLKDFWITSLATLPAPDAQGISTFKGRQYGKVPEGGTVQMGLDPDSGHYRATLPSELNPSGPILQFDAKSRLWQPVEDFVASTYSLSDARLQAYRTDLHFATVDPDSDGLYRFNGKLYVEIGQYAYQVLHDLNASSPHTVVLRIVRPGDPVSLHEHNIYVGSRMGSSQPIVFDTRHGWRGINVKGAAGMRRRAQAGRSEFEFMEIKLKIKEINQTLLANDQKNRDLISAWETARDSEGDPTARVNREKKALSARKKHNKQELQVLEEALSFYEADKSVIKPLLQKSVYNQKIIELNKRKMHVYQQFVECNLTRQDLDGSLLDLQPHRLSRTVTVLSKILGRMRERQRIADDLVKKWGLSPDDASLTAISPMHILDIVASWVLAKSLMLNNPQSSVDSPRASDLAVEFGRATFIYGALDRIPQTSHPAVMSSLSGELAAIRDWYERLDLPAGPEHVSSRDEIIAELKIFEETLAARLNHYHQQTERSAPSSHDQPIDFEFIPPQERRGREPGPKRIVRVKKLGIYKIEVGESRRTAQNEVVIDVRNPLDPERRVQTYERRDGEWQPVTPTSDKDLPTLMAEADQHLKRTDAHVNDALYEERQKYNPDNIVEKLEARARKMDETAARLERFGLSDANRSALVERLKRDSARLRAEGENIRIRIYKDKNFLCVDRLLYLIDKGHVGAVKIADRLKRGKGGDREYLDMYSLTDAANAAPLWEAHFHYPTPNAGQLDFNVRGAHLKTLEQSRKGASSQRREERAHGKHTAIWREYFDGRAAQRIFDLATKGAAASE